MAGRGARPARTRILRSRTELRPRRLHSRSGDFRSAPEAERRGSPGQLARGVNAYQFAARHPEKVRGLIIEDIGAEVSDDLSFVLAWEGEFATREALAERVGPRLLPYLQDSFRKTPTGWRVAFDPREIVASGRSLSGDHWRDWLATECPTLLIRGRDSRVTTQAAVEEMASRRPNTRLAILDGGHVIHLDNPTGFANAVREFLSELKASSDEPRRVP